MKMVVAIMLALAIGAFAGYSGYLDPVIDRIMRKLDPMLSPDKEVKKATTDAGREVLYWYDPMHPQQRFDEPGPSPFMDMELVPRYADEVEYEPGLVRITPGIQQLMGIRTAQVERVALPRVINTFGSVEYDEGRLSHVHIRVEGWVERLTAQAVGDHVRKGQLLFELYSPTLVNAQDELVQAVRDGRDRMIAASRERLLALGMSRTQIEQVERSGQTLQRVPIHAHHDGVISALSVREGMYVTPETDIMAIADLSTVWMIAEVFEQEFDWLAIGQRAEITLPYIPGEIRTSEITYVYPRLDPVTRAVRVRLPLENPDAKLRLGMWSQVRLFAEPLDDVIAIPREALIRTGHSARVVVREDEQRFRVREVVPGVESGDRIEIRTGLEQGEEVVVSGQFLLDSEAALRAGHDRLEGMDHQHH
jgi:membrane fusion protein, copper/silver efflux system